MIVKTSNKYINQTLILPVVGEIKLDENASFDCPEDKVEEFLAATRGSLEFSQLERKVKEKIKIPELPKVLDKIDDTPIDPELLKASIEDATIEELRDIAALVPGVKKKDIKDLDLEALKAFLLSKIEPAPAK